MEVEYTAIGESTYKQKDNEVKTYGNFEYVLTGIAVNSGVRLQIQLNEGKVSNCNIWRIPSCKKCQAINS